jgi:hydrogenase maturation protease
MNYHNGRTLVLGLGNPILSDDGIGCRVALALKEKLKEPEIDVMEASLAGLDFLDVLAPYDRAIIIDAIQTKEGTPGQIYRLEPEILSSTCHASTPHDVNFATAIELGKQLGLPLPQQIIIFAVEVKDVTSFSEACTPEVAAAIPTCVSLVVHEVSGSYNKAAKLSGLVS